MPCVFTLKTSFSETEVCWTMVTVKLRLVEMNKRSLRAFEHCEVNLLKFFVQ